MSDLRDDLELDDIADTADDEAAYDLLQRDEGHEDRHEFRPCSESGECTFTPNASRGYYGDACGRPEDDHTVHDPDERAATLAYRAANYGPGVQR